MISYIYDGSFEGLLTVIAMAVCNAEEVCAITAGELQPDLFTEIKRVEADLLLAGNFFESIAGQVSKTALQNIGYCFLSQTPGIEKVILNFIRLLLLQGERVTQNIADPTIFEVRRICEKVSHEVERMHEYVRFRKLNNGIYYAPIAPDHNIIQLIAPHFRDRFADQLWLIHDTGRKTGIYYDGNRCRFIPFMEMADEVNDSCTPFSADREPGVFDRAEMGYQSMWDQYFQHIAIPERANKRQQRQRMPERYWRYLVENVKG